MSLKRKAASIEISITITQDAEANQPATKVVAVEANQPAAKVVQANQEAVKAAEANHPAVKATEANQDTTAIVAEKQRLRDITQLADQATTLEQLKQIEVK